MSHDADQPAERPAAEETFLRRWARRKHAARREAEVAREAGPAERAAALEQPSPAPAQPPAQAPVPAGSVAAKDAASAEPPAPLPPIESLTFDSDFSAFLAPHVPEELKRQALKKLLRDPRFNVMDGLDVYIDDYSQPSPLSSELARGLAHARYIFEPPPTRVNAQGHVEDVPEEERTLLAAASTPGADVGAGEADEQPAHGAAAAPDESIDPMPSHAQPDADGGDAAHPARDSGS